MPEQEDLTPMDDAAGLLEVVYDPLPSEALTRLVSDHVIGVNFARTGASDWHPANFFLKNRRGEWLGGATGYIWGDWLHVTFLWVSETMRGHGHGTRLMDAAESLAKERGAHMATLETFTFQAPDFYAKRGYTEIGRLEGYPPGHAKLFLSKSLAP